MTLKFIFVTPRQLIERGTEGKEMKEIRVNLYVPPSSNSASSTKYDLIGHKEDFRVNMQFALGTAMIGEGNSKYFLECVCRGIQLSVEGINIVLCYTFIELSHQSDLGQQSVSLCEDDSILDDSLSVSLFEPNPSTGNTSQNRSQTTDNQVSAPTTSTSASHKDNAISDIATIPPSIDSQSDSNDLDFDSGGYDDVQSDFNNDEDIQSSEKQSETDNTNKPITDEQTDEVQTRRKSNRCAKEASNTEQMAPLADPWKPITPHEAANTIPKPIRRGRTRRAPTKYVQLSGTKSRPKKTPPNAEMQPIVPVEDFMIQQLSGGKYSLNGLRVGNKDTCMAAELQDRADNVEKMRKRKAALENKQNNNFLEAVEDEAILEIENNQESPEDVDNNWDDVDFDHDPLPDPHEGGIAALVPADIVHQENQLGSTGVGNDADTSNEVDSYEELVMKRVAAYVAQSQDYIESTDLAKRVAKWHDSIGPRLDAVEKRGNFDIHQYGSRILEYFPDGVAKTTVPFTDIARGKEREEVSRYFLSSLMLANTYNIEISNSTNEPLAMDQVEMTLLSTKRHHENMFQETNVGEPGKSTISPKRKGRKSKPLNSNPNYTSDEEDVPSTSTSSKISIKNIKGKNKRTSKVNGHLNPIAEEQFTAIDDSPVINNPLSESYLEQLDDPNISSAQASPGIYSNVQLQQNPEFATNGTMDLPSNNKFKVPASSIDGYKSGRKRKIR